ncbi:MULTISPECIES: hypothetical protein [Pseudomonas]|uniref:DUF1090 domain-containing protein n=1 Tax=Pseudomonas yamanorum TaxID=515393 RepID=A0A143G9U9_9PSED|nr:MULTISPECIES: hypothetical protein [Pseudomonas]AMW81023.1 hypothetical protein AK972_0223 [Pseudomonas yamanorum]MBK5411192.1 hypothetical protein [Pseudomonas sp. TH34]MBV6659887.1 hypothetical protein [Pseudomonas yamanorum]MDR0187853.1 hypothetical protein [Pseudomonas yamanorum]NVZ89146.1 hypothetical protein [Pseudomonas yamanorum]
MRISTLAPAALLLSLFALPAHADLSALSGLTSQLGVSSGDCEKQGKDLQAKVDAAKANGEELKVKAMQAALDQVNKGCKKVGESQAKLDASQQKQQAKADSNDTVKALGGLFK